MSLLFVFLLSRIWSRGRAWLQRCLAGLRLGVVYLLGLELEKALRMSSEPDLGNRVSKTKQEKAHLKWWSLHISAARVEWGGRCKQTNRAVAVSFRGYLGVGDINTHLRAK